MKNIYYTLLLLVVLTGCKEEIYEAEADFMASGSDEAMTTQQASVAPLLMSNNTLHADSEQYSQKIIRSANLRFETSDLDKTAENIKNAVSSYNAQIQTDSENKNNYSLSRNMVIRIPADKFDVFVNDISKGVTYFERKEISATDVTEEFVDVSARLKAKKALEQRYLELLKKASKVSEMLEIEKELSTIREDIEVQEGRLRYMQDRVSLSTVYIEFYKTIENHPDATVSYGSKVVNALKSGFNGISTFFIGLLQVWPFILIFVIALIIIRKRIKKKRRI